MSHASHHNSLTGNKKLDHENFSHIISVRSDKLASWLDKGYEEIEHSGDSCLIGKRKE